MYVLFGVPCKDILDEMKAIASVMSLLIYVGPWPFVFHRVHVVGANA